MCASSARSCPVYSSELLYKLIIVVQSMPGATASRAFSTTADRW